MNLKACKNIGLTSGGNIKVNTERIEGFSGGLDNLLGRGSSEEESGSKDIFHRFLNGIS